MDDHDGIERVQGGHFESVDRKKKRAIANSNERKRMQSINAGFQCLRKLVSTYAQVTAEKPSKASILQYTSDLIKQLLAEKAQLSADKSHLELLVGGVSLPPPPTTVCISPPPPAKRRKRDAESSSSDEGIDDVTRNVSFFSEEEGGGGGGGSGVLVVSLLKQKVVHLQRQLDEERRLRLVAETERRRIECLSFSLTLSPSSSVSQQLVRPEKNVLQVAAPSHDVCSAPNDLNDFSSTWRRNLDTIVEAIRHVEGDSLEFIRTTSPPPPPPSAARFPDDLESRRPSSADDEVTLTSFESR